MSGTLEKVWPTLRWGINRNTTATMKGANMKERVRKKAKVELDALLGRGVFARFVENRHQSIIDTRQSQPSSSSIAMLAIGTAFLVVPTLTKE